MANPTPPHGTVPEHLFVRCFPNLAPFIPAQIDLELLSKTMLDQSARAPTVGSKIAAGQTYFGQFIDHDITLDNTTQFGQRPDVNTLPNARTSWFDLDSVYGETNQYLNPQGLFTIGKNAVGEDDLPRDAAGNAIIPDGRNDENIIISQLQLAFLKFHNRVFGDVKLANPTFTIDQLITESKRIVTMHYQWLVVNDFLSQMCGKFFARLFDPTGKPIISPEIQAIYPKMAIEFSGAIYRYGHSLVRDAYYINKGFDVIPIFSPSLPPPLVTNPDLRGSRPLPPNFTVDWSEFFPMPFSKGFQVTEHFDPFVTESLYTLPFVVASDLPPILPLRNLMRGVVYGLPSGQDIARSFGIPANEILSASAGNLVIQTVNPLVTPNDLYHLTTVFGEATPLFYYTLKDNHVNGEGNHLGSLPAKIIGEVILNLMVNNPNSYLNTGFSPVAGQYGCIVSGKYNFAEFFTYALNLNTFTSADIIPTAQSNFFDPFDNKTFTFALTGHANLPQLGLPAEIMVQPWTGFTLHQFDPSLPLLHATQVEINTVAANAIKFGVDSYLAVVQFLNNRTIIAIAQGNLLPLTPPAPGPAIFPPAIPPPPEPVPPIVLTPEQKRANAVFLSQDVAQYMTKFEAAADASRAQNEINIALQGVVAPPAVVVPP